jgi:hypothetical protein
MKKNNAATSESMKTIVLILLLFPAILSYSQEKFFGLQTIKGSEEFESSEQTSRMIVLSYPKYDVILQKNIKVCGEMITVCDNENSVGDTIISIKGGPIYFYGIYKNFLFVDEGTGTIRYMMVYELQSQSFIYSFQYQHSPKVESDSVFYDYPLPMDKKTYAENPPCDDLIAKGLQYGYFEKRIYLLKHRESINTGIIKCEYRE